MKLGRKGKPVHETGVVESLKTNSVAVGSVLTPAVEYIPRVLKLASRVLDSVLVAMVASAVTVYVLKPGECTV